MKSLVRFSTTTLVTALLITAVTGCSSKSKKGDDPASPGSPEASVSDDGEKSGGAVSKDGVEAPTSKSGSLDSKYKALGQALRSGGKQGNVQDEATKILSLNQNDPVALNALALIHLRRGRTGAAKLLLGRALEKNPPTAPLLNNLGVALLDEGELDAAIANFKKALQLDDHHAEALGNLGSIYAQAGDYAKAQSLLEASYKQNRGNLQVANNYALSLRAAKDYEGARRIYDDILKQNSKEVTTLLNYAILLIDFMNKPKDGLDLVYKVKLLETERKDVLSRANALEKKVRSEVK